MTDTTHACPPDGSGLMPCCGRTPLEVPRTDRMTEDPAAVTCGAATFALWLDASDGSIASHDGVRWPDGTTTIHHRYHRGLTATHSSPEAACQSAYGKQGRIVWNAAARTTPDNPVASDDDTELTADEARDLATDLGHELYEAQDALMFAREMCDLADQNGTPVTTARVRQWLQGAPKCGRQAFAVAAPATADDGRRERVAAAIRDYIGDPCAPRFTYGITDAVLAALDPKEPTP